MAKPNLPEKFEELLDAVKGKRARVVIDHILRHGVISIETLTNEYGYQHPPRAIQDVKDNGVPLVATNTTNTQGKPISEYRFPDDPLGAIRAARGRGRFPKVFKKELARADGAMCAMCNAEYPLKMLQVDHRVPFVVRPDDLDADLKTTDYQLLCAPHNAAKGKACKTCPNWGPKGDAAVCATCFYSAPATFVHVATEDVRRLDLEWRGQETSDFDELRAQATESELDVHEFAKQALRRHLKAGSDEDGQEHQR